jgi:cephalosporin hydroxylase
VALFSQRRVVDAFHRLYYNAREDSRTLGNTRFLGVDVQKCPLDLWVYQEILFETRPDVIIETGTAAGGSALYMASVCDLLGVGRIVTVDIEARPNRPVHARIRYVTGSSVDAKVVAEATRDIQIGEKVMVILDSDHSRDHVFAELGAYSGLVFPGGYLIIEDTNVNGHPVRPKFGPGPMEAVDDFLRAGPPFEIDTSREKFFLTFNPRGYLKRVE